MKLCRSKKLHSAHCALLLLTFAAYAAAGQDKLPDFATTVQQLELRLGGEIGVFAVDTSSGKELAYRADERFAMASTFKPLLVAAVLARVDAGTLALEDRYGIDGVRMESYSPVVGELDHGETLPLSTLCDAAITLSDNTATNMLLNLIGGPASLTQFLRSAGDQITRLDRFETELNTNNPGDERDTSTPRAMTHSVVRLLTSDVLSDSSKRLLGNWLVASKTGSSRLRAGLPVNWTIGDKTGMGMNGAANNFAVAWPPGRAPIIMTVFMSGSDEKVAVLDAGHAEIAAAIADSFR